MAKTDKTRKSPDAGAERRRKGNLKAVEDKLRAEETSLHQQIAELESRYAGEEGNHVYEDDFGDPETATYERERLLSLLENARDLLEQVKHALKRVEDGTYGTCESCGKTIEAARLRALPYASLCISCKRKVERG